MSKHQEFRDFVLNHEFDQFAKICDGRAVFHLWRDEYEALQSALAKNGGGLSTLAQSKLEKMGATVHGVLAKNEAGAWVAVSDAGRVMWLDGFEGQTACGQGGEAVAYAAVNGSDPSRIAGLCTTEEIAELNAQRIGGDVRPLVFGDTHPSASAPDELVSERSTLADLLRDAAMAENKVDTCYDEPNKNPRLAAALNWLADWLSTTPQTAGKTCKWHSDDNGSWISRCGKEWYFEDGGPEENGMNFCVKCGNRCIEIGDSEDGSESYDNAM